MQIQNLTCIQFRNHLEKKVFFSPNINIIVGRNGAGKTNILNAIHYLAMTQGFLGKIINEDITYFKDNFYLEGNFIKKSFTDDEYEEIGRPLTTNNSMSLTESFPEEIINIKYQYVRDQSKKIKINEKKLIKLKSHIGTLPVILFSPDDVDVVKWGSNARKKLFDTILCQINKDYLNDLIEYNHVIVQKNSFLKQCKHGNVDKVLIKLYNGKISNIGSRIFNVRKNFLKEFLPFFIKYYRIISDTNYLDIAEKIKENEGSMISEHPSIQYKSHFQDPNYNDKIEQSLSKDLILGYTTIGVHRDDFIFLLNDNNIKYTASQGQKKTFFIAFRLAQSYLILKKLGIKPILLMDDIFEKLDELRTSNVIELLKNGKAGQVILTQAYLEYNLKIYKKKIPKINIIKL